MIEFSKHSGIYTIKVKQNIKMTLNDAWDFFSNPKNLSIITPKKLIVFFVLRLLFIMY